MKVFSLAMLKMITVHLPWHPRKGLKAITHLVMLMIIISLWHPRKGLKAR